MKAFKAFTKPFEAPQRSMKIKTSVNFILIQLSEMHGPEMLGSIDFAFSETFHLSILLATS